MTLAPWSELATALGLGLASSLTVCTMACLPFIGTWVLGQGRDATQGLRDVLLFLLGRWCAYTLMGAMAGSGPEEWLENPAWQWLGGVLFLVAGGQMWRQGTGPCPGVHRTLPPWQLGLAQAMTPCPPLVGLLTLCVLSGSPLVGAMLAAAFGVGTMVSPLLLLTPVIAGAGHALVAQSRGGLPWMRRGAALLLMLLGVKHMPWPL